ncbi:protein unc-13 homolog [Bidens hawaiensis]|uniref:protein unc-13 homolog n=1 Tax=Bidens hawaiensis TaxID=980011 RepID=UPI004049800A
MVLLDRHEYFQDPTNHICVPSPPTPQLDATNGLSFPFGHIDGLRPNDLRATAYEIFFTSCRSSQGFGGRPNINVYPFESRDHRSRSPGSPGSPSSPCSPYSGVGMAVTSRVKKTLGLKMLNRTPSTRRSNSWGSNPFSPSGYNNSPRSPRGSFSTLPSRSNIRRPMTSAELMRQQMKVSEDSDARVRKTLMRTLVGQTGRRANTIILPLELLRQLKAGEFEDANEYHEWQKRQLKTLEAGLLDYPSIPIEKGNTFRKCLRDIVNSSNVKPIDTSKNSEIMKTVCNCVVFLSWRSPNEARTDVCHWADGYPLNVNLYLHLLQAIFDLKDETCVADEVDELLELIKKTWPVLGITRQIHNLCLTWVLFQQYVITGQVEYDLLRASLTMLTEVANDARKIDRDPIYVNMLSAMLSSMIKWSENRLLDYHESFNRETVDLMENILPLAFSAVKILEESGYEDTSDSSGNKVDQYIRSSLRKAFAKMVKNMNTMNGSFKLRDESGKLIELAKRTEDLAFREKEMFSPVLKTWHLFSAGVAAVTLQTCYGSMLRQFLAANTMLSNEIVILLQRADKLEKVLVNMVVEDSIECENGGRTFVREMVPYDVDSIVLRYLRQWVQDCLKRVKDVVETAKETETWNPKSKSEPYAQSTAELLKQTKEAVESFFDISISISEDLVREFADAIERILHDYTAFVASCGSKQSYVPTLPPLTRCGQGSKFTRLWRIAAVAQCGVNLGDSGLEEGNYSRPSTSRGTQRLYIRLNSLHYILSQLNTIDKILSISPRIVAQSPRNRFSGNRKPVGGSYFEQTRSTIQWATKHVSGIAAYRLIYLDSNSVFYGSLYVGDVETSRIGPALKIMKHNLTLLTAIVTERAQPLAIKELMKATFDAYLRILLAGGISRDFTRSDHRIIEEDLRNLKKLFSGCGEGLIVEDAVDREAEAAEGVVALMGKPTEQLVDEFSALVCDGNGVGVMGGSGKKLPMPPTTGKWSSMDPNTILRVFCHRNEGAANLFLKKTFQLPKRK